MLMDVKCSAVTSIAVHLTFDDGTTKNSVIGVGDLVSVEYNNNGLRKQVDGKVLKISLVRTSLCSFTYNLFQTELDPI